MNRELIEARLAALRAGLAKLREDALVTEGAVQDCEYWLGVLPEQSDGTDNRDVPGEDDPTGQ